MFLDSLRLAHEQSSVSVFNSFDLRLDFNSVDPAVTVQGAAITDWDAISPSTIDGVVIGSGVTLNINHRGEREPQFANNGGIGCGGTFEPTLGTEAFFLRKTVLHLNGLLRIH